MKKVHQRRRSESPEHVTEVQWHLPEPKRVHTERHIMEFKANGGDVCGAINVDDVFTVSLFVETGCYTVDGQTRSEWGAQLEIDMRAFIEDAISQITGKTISDMEMSVHDP